MNCPSEEDNAFLRCIRTGPPAKCPSSPFSIWPLNSLRHFSSTNDRSDPLIGHFRIEVIVMIMPGAHRGVRTAFLFWRQAWDRHHNLLRNARQEKSIPPPQITQPATALSQSAYRQDR